MNGGWESSATRHGINVTVSGTVVNSVGKPARNAQHDSLVEDPSGEGSHLHLSKICLSQGEFRVHFGARQKRPEVARLRYS